MDVVSLAGGMLSWRDGRYYYSADGLPSEPEQLAQRRLRQALRRIVDDCRSSVRRERRQRGRFAIVLPVKVETEDGRCVMLLTSNLSSSGIRLIGPTSLLGEKIRVSLARDESTTPTCFFVQIVWSSFVSEGLCENGGAFLDVAPSRISRHRDAPRET